jgi:hypothetical protein
VKARLGKLIRAFKMAGLPSSRQLTGDWHMRNIGAFCMSCVGDAAAAVAGHGDMNVATFTAKADALKARVGALGAPDIKLLWRSECSRQNLSRDDMADKRRGVLRLCHRKAALNSDQLLAHLRTYPAAVRPKTTITTAMFDVMKKRYPCT